MNLFRRISTSGVLVVLLTASVAATYADGKNKKVDLSKAKETVNSIRPSDPPKESNTPKRNPVTLSPAAPKAKEHKEPPSPVNRNNPTGNKEVQRGFNEHQKSHNKN